jgi:hypothetical protein
VDDSLFQTRMIAPKPTSQIRIWTTRLKERCPPGLTTEHENPMQVVN